MKLIIHLIVINIDETLKQPKPFFFSGKFSDLRLLTFLGTNIWKKSRYYYTSGIFLLGLEPVTFQGKINSLLFIVTNCHIVVLGM